MWKSSHVKLAKYLTEQEEFFCLNKHRTVFLLGSILPDCMPSFITRRHRLEDTLFILKKELYSIESCNKVDFHFCLHLGIALHYVADYFTYPHNCIFYGSFLEHCIWEWQQSKALTKVLQKPLDSTQSSIFNTEAFIKYLLKKHRAYLKEGVCLATDCKYVVEVCYLLTSIAIHLEQAQIAVVSR